MQQSWELMWTKENYIFAFAFKEPHLLALPYPCLPDYWGGCGRKECVSGSKAAWHQLQWRDARCWDFTYQTSQEHLFWFSIWYYPGRQAPFIFPQKHFFHSLPMKTGMTIFPVWRTWSWEGIFLNRLPYFRDLAAIHAFVYITPNTWILGNIHISDYFSACHFDGIDLAYVSVWFELDSSGVYKGWREFQQHLLLLICTFCFFQEAFQSWTTGCIFNIPQRCKRLTVKQVYV